MPSYAPHNKKKLFHPTELLRTSRDLPLSQLRFPCNFYCAKCDVKVLPGDFIYFFGINGYGENTAPAIWAIPELNPFDDEHPISTDLPNVKYGVWKTGGKKGLGRQLLCTNDHFVGQVNFDRIETPRAGKMGFRAKFYYSWWTGTKSPILNVDMDVEEIKRRTEQSFLNARKDLESAEAIYYTGPNAEPSVENNARRLLEQVADSETKDTLSKILKDDDFGSEDWEILQYGFAVWLKKKMKLRDLQVVYEECILECDKFKKLKEKFPEVYEIFIADFLNNIKWHLKDHVIRKKLGPSPCIELAEKVYVHIKKPDGPPHRKITTFLMEIVKHGPDHLARIKKLYDEAEDHIYVFNKYISLSFDWQSTLYFALRKFDNMLPPSTFSELFNKAKVEKKLNDIILHPLLSKISYNEIRDKNDVYQCLNNVLYQCRRSPEKIKNDVNDLYKRLQPKVPMKLQDEIKFSKALFDGDDHDILRAKFQVLTPQMAAHFIAISAETPEDINEKDLQIVLSAFPEPTVNRYPNQAKIDLHSDLRLDKDTIQVLAVVFREQYRKIVDAPWASEGLEVVSGIGNGLAKSFMWRFFIALGIFPDEDKSNQGTMWIRKIDLRILRKVLDDAKALETAKTSNAPFVHKRQLNQKSGWKRPGTGGRSNKAAGSANMSREC